MPRLCVALDLNKDQALRLADKLLGYPLILKVGPKLFLEGGKDLIEGLKEKGFEVFLDMKFHDIPNTVALAVETVSRMGVDYLTLHTLGGPEMLEMAVSRKGNTKLLGVTLLTSHGEEFLAFIRSGYGSLKDFVLSLAQTASKAGLDGVVCSGHEVREIKEKTGLLTVVPGIRLGSRRDDQKRTMTPKEAAEKGADILVMGREIYLSPQPEEVVRRVLEQIEKP